MAKPKTSPTNLQQGEISFWSGLSSLGVYNLEISSNAGNNITDLLGLYGSSMRDPHCFPVIKSQIITNQNIV